MIDVEAINEKYLIALRALQDIMNEIGQSWSVDNFYVYLDKIHASGVKDDVAYFLRELKRLSVKEEGPKDIFISNSVTPEHDYYDPNTILEDLWLFWDGYYVKVEDFLETREPEKMKLVPLGDEGKCLLITKTNFRFQGESPKARVEVPPQLSITVKSENDDVIELKAARLANCKELLRIYREYLASLFPL